MEERREDLTKRLRRVEGQIRGILRMLDEDRPCDEILVQLSAIRAAINRVGMQLIAGQISECVNKAEEDRKESLEKAINDFLKFS